MFLVYVKVLSEIMYAGYWLKSHEYMNLKA